MNTRLKVVPPAESGGIPISTKKKLKDLEVRVQAGDSDAIRARWESGRELLVLRDNKKLPYGTRESLLVELGIEQTEAWRRWRFAEVCPDEDSFSRFTGQLLRSSQQLSWSAIYKSFPPKNPGKAKPYSKSGPKKAQPKQSTKQPTKQDIADAQSVIKKLARPGVRAAIKDAAAEDAATKQAQRLAEHQEKEEARRQKEEEQWNQQVALAARHQLVAGEVTWENISDMTESYDDTLKRVEEHLDFMLVPSQVRMKVLKRQFGSVQTRLYRITGRMFPDYKGGPVADIGMTDVIVVNEKPSRP